MVLVIFGHSGDTKHTGEVPLTNVNINVKCPDLSPNLLILIPWIFLRTENERFILIRSHEVIMDAR